MKITDVVNVTFPLTLSDRYAYHSSNGYYFNNNIWGLKPSETNNQTTTIDVASTAGVAYHVDWCFPGNSSSDKEEDYQVKSYPYAGLELDEKTKVDDIRSLWTKSEWGYILPGDSRANVALDIFTSKDKDRDISSGDYELMIWYASHPHYLHQNKLTSHRLASYDAHPIGTSHGMTNISSDPWELFVGHNGETKVYSFVAPEKRPSWEGDVMPFFDYIDEEYDFPAGEQYLTAFQFGTEAYVGSGLFAVWYWMAELTSKS